MARDPYSLPGYDAWKTRSPYENERDTDIVWTVQQYSPHNLTPSTLGQYSSETQAYAEANRWLLSLHGTDPEFADDYFYEVVEQDLLEDCICRGSPNKWCPLHGIDPDQYDPYE